MLFKGRQIKLRPLKKGDYLTTIKWRDENELRLLAQFHLLPVTNELEKEWMDALVKSKNNKEIYFAIEEIKSSNLLGYFQIKNINWSSRTAWLGIIIGDQNSRGKGYGSETMQLGLDYAFSFLNLRKISLEVISANKTALALYKKFGFREEGVMKEQFYFNNKYYDVIIMSCYDRDFK